MICNNSIRSIDAVCILFAKFALIWPYSADFLHFLEDRYEDVGVIVRPLALDYGHQSLEAHASVNVLCRKWPERPIIFTVELDENIVPDFEDIWVVLIDQMCSVAVSNTVKMDFAVREINMVLLYRLIEFTCKAHMVPLHPFLCPVSDVRGGMDRHIPQKLSCAFPGRI